MLSGSIDRQADVVADVAEVEPAKREAFVRGLKLALRAHLDVDFLMVVAAVGAAFIGKWVDGGLLLFLFALGNALEHYAMGQARKAIRALGKLAPKTARLLRGTQAQEVPVAQLQVMSHDRCYNVCGGPRRHPGWSGRRFWH